MKILVDMNLSPAWVTVLNNHAITAVHWSTVGDPRAEDSVIMDWAQAEGPSVIQVRTHDVTPEHLEPALIDVLENNRSALEAGCLIVLDETRSRVRILPLTLRL